MGDDRQSDAQQIARLEAKMDMALVEIARIAADRKDCRSHCDSEMPKVHDRITNLKGVVDKMQGFLSMHHWLLIAAELAGLGAIVFLGMHK